MKNWLIFGQLIIILILVYVIITDDSSIRTEPFDDSPHLDSLETLARERDSLEVVANRLQLQRDSLLSLPPKIIQYYDNQRSIIPDGTVVQLDSIIRANAGI